MKDFYEDLIDLGFKKTDLKLSDSISYTKGKISIFELSSGENSLYIGIQKVFDSVTPDKIEDILLLDQILNEV